MRSPWLTPPVGLSASGQGRDLFVLAAVRAFALGAPCPEPPADESWLEVAEDAGVLVVLLDHLQRSGHPVPASADQGRYRGIATRMRAMVDVHDVGAALDSAGVRWLVVKGPVLAEAVYSRTSVRSYSDLDVLVHPEDLGIALQALQEARFGLLDQNWGLIASSGRGEVSLTTPNGNLLDLHWNLVNDRRTRRSFALDVRAMVDRRIHVDVDGQSVPALDPLDTVLHLGLHAGLSGGHRLQWLLDLHQAVRWSRCTPEELATRAAQLRLRLPMRVMLDRVARYLDPEFSEWAQGMPAGAGWTRVCAAVSALALPLGARTGRRTGRLVFASTRPTTVGSLIACIRAALVAVRDSVPLLDRSVGVAVLHAASGNSADRDRWLAEARASG